MIHSCLVCVCELRVLRWGWRQPAHSHRNRHILSALLLSMKRNIMKHHMTCHEVRPEGRSTILAWESALESTFACILGNAMAEALETDSPGCLGRLGLRFVSARSDFWRRKCLDTGACHMCLSTLGRASVWQMRCANLHDFTCVLVSMLRGCSNVHDRRLDNSDHARADVESRRALGKVG